MDQKSREEVLEAKVEEHSLQIQQLHDEVDFKKWKIDSLIEKIDNLSSVEILSIVADIENEFSIKITEDEMLEISTVKELANIIENKSSKSN